MFHLILTYIHISMIINFNLVLIFLLYHIPHLIYIKGLFAR